MLTVKSCSICTSPWVLVLSFCFCTIVFLRMFRRRPALPFPPGPKGLPVIGNALDMPRDHPWLTYWKWGEKSNSDIVHVKSLGTHLIVLNSAKAVRELFEKRSSIYSDRPPLPSLSLLLRMSWNLAFLPYGPTWRTWRKVFHEHFHSSASQQYRPRKVKAARQLLENLLCTPEDYKRHIRFMVGRVIVSIAYGIDITPHNDPYISLAETALQAIDSATTTGWTFDMLPFYKYLPWWFPGASFKKEAARFVPHIDNVLNKPYQTVKDALATGIAMPSIAASMITSLPDKPSDEDELASKAIPATMYLGGTDTTTASLLSFFLAMVLHPDAQSKAQTEIDNVVGTERLPNFDDETSLPYVSALIEEVTRFYSVAPIAVPHRLVADDVYEGYFLPADSIVIANLWAVLHDESVFPEPLRFNPERFLDRKAKPPNFTFGFGRRVCPGRSIAQASLWITIASVLAAFDISPVVDGRGVPQIPKGEYSGGIISHPEDFTCMIRPRSKQAEELIVSSMRDSD